MLLINIAKGPIVNYVQVGRGGGVLEGGEGTILKQASFWGVSSLLVRNMRGVKFYDTATAVVPRALSKIS